MEKFIARYRSLVTGVLSGFDRLVFRGSLLPLFRDGGMFFFLERAGVRLLDFKDFVTRTSERVKQAAYEEAERMGRPVRYLESSEWDKEKIAERVLAEQPIDRGLICVLTAVEPCMSFEYHRSADRKERGLRLRPKKCLHLYRYFVHPLFGFMSVRLQTWFPFNIQVCLNGREWLARQLERRRSEFKRADNCFTWLGNVELAQRLMDEQLQTDWPAVLDAVARRANPLHAEIFAAQPMDYYWSGYQTEWATDILFKDPQTLAGICPALWRHALDHFKSPDVMRFLGGKVHGNFTGEIVTSFKNRPEGVRVKHWVRGNSIKMYDKAGSVLRVETTIARTTDFKVFRPAHDQPNGKLEWRPLRKGVADLHRRAQLSQRSNEAYLETLSAVDDKTPCAKFFDAVCRPVVEDGRRFRALRLHDPADLAPLDAISRGEFAPAGFRNRDLRSLIHRSLANHTLRDRRRLSAKMSRQLRLLRAHGVIKKIPKTHRYRLTSRGLLLTAALQATRRANIKDLLKVA
ncbi:MAG: hypothetical protein C3F15_15980 [Holophagae bacterium]|nr:MAG: hypothetical protein C3F15_15980 [Holophagae bacterium]